MRNTKKSSGSGTSLSAAPHIAIKPEALAMLEAYAQLAPGEIGGFGSVYVDRAENAIVVDELIVPRQKAGPANVHIDESAMADLLQDAFDLGIKSDHLRCFWHSHAEMQTFFSATDVQSASDLLAASPWVLCLVVNKAGDIRADLVIREPTAIWLQNLDVVTWLAPEIIDRVQHDIDTKVETQNGAVASHCQTHWQDGSIESDDQKEEDYDRGNGVRATTSGGTVAAAYDVGSYSVNYRDRYDGLLCGSGAGQKYGATRRHQGIRR